MLFLYVPTFADELKSFSLDCSEKRISWFERCSERCSRGQGYPSQPLDAFVNM